MALQALVLVASSARAVVLAETRVAVLLAVVIVKPTLAISAFNVQESLLRAVFELLGPVGEHRARLTPIARAE